MEINHAVILDDDNVPYTPERFQTEPQAAQKFLELVESNSMGMLDNWREWTEDFIILEASKHLYDLEQALIHSDWLRQREKLH